MKLNLVTARTGALWVKLGVQTFFKQPLALAGLFFTFMALMTVVSLLPFVGLALAMTLMPAATLGLMVATQTASQGRFPMPTLLLAAFRADRAVTRAILLLGLWYAAGFLLAMGASWLVDSGGFAGVYLGGRSPTRELMLEADFQAAMWVFIGLHLPLSLLFWHAPALVYWHGMTPLKSVFFSAVACWKNLRAFVVFGLLWMFLLALMILLLTALGSLLDNATLTGELLFPTLLLMASMFFSSLYFTFRDCFSDANASTPAVSQPPV